VTEPQFSLILPVHNQADHLERIVDGYSRDACLSIALELQRRYSAVRAYHEARAGWGRAVKRGIRESRGELICYTNCARTTDRDLTLILLYARAFPTTVVKANRRVRETLLRRTASLLYNVECRALFDLSCWDVNGTPKVFPRSFDALLRLERDDDLVDAEFVAICRRRDYPMVEVPIFSARRHGGLSTTDVWSAIALYVGAIRLARAIRRSYA